MKSRELLLVLLSVLLGWGTGARARSQFNPSPPADEKCIVEGVVTSATSGKPVEGAWVILRSQQGELKPAFPPEVTVHTVLTDAGGHFEIRDVSPYFEGLNVGKDGYVEWERDGSRYALEPVNHFSIRLMPAGVISGRVTDGHGSPLILARVLAAKVNFSDSGRRVWGNWQEAFRTDDRGDYRIFGLSPGRYVVIVNYEFGESRFYAFQASGFASLNQYAYPSHVLYPGTRQISKAKEIVVAPGEEVSGINFRLDLERTYQISGTVTGILKSTPYFIPQISLTVRGNGFESTFPGSVPAIAGASAPDGQFLVRNVVPGSYELTVAQNLPPGRRVARVPVEVRDHDIRGLKVTLAEALDVPVKLKVEGPPIRESYFTLFLNGQNLPSILAIRGRNGSLRLPSVPPGSYRIYLWGLLGNSYLKSARLGTKDVLKAPVEIVPGQPPAPLDIVIGGDGAELSGAVTGRDGRPDAGAAVVLVPEPALCDLSFLFKSTRSDSLGRFKLEGIRPGTYTVFAWDNVEAWTWLDPAFLEGMEGRGIPLALGKGEQKTIDLRSIQVLPTAGGRP